VLSAAVVSCGRRLSVSRTGRQRVYSASPAGFCACRAAASSELHVGVITYPANDDGEPSDTECACTAAALTRVSTTDGHPGTAISLDRNRRTVAGSCKSAPSLPLIRRVHLDRHGERRRAAAAGLSLAQ
jgi:hypothetical protein